MSPIQKSTKKWLGKKNTCDVASHYNVHLKCAPLRYNNGVSFILVILYIGDLAVCLWVFDIGFLFNRFTERVALEQSIECHWNVNR